MLLANALVAKSPFMQLVKSEMQYMGVIKERHTATTS